MMSLQHQNRRPTSPPSADADHPVRRSDIRIHKLDDEGLIHDSISGDTHWLNGTALFIWQKCDGGHSTGDIARMMTQVYEVSFDSALDHVERLMKELAARNLVRPTPETQPRGDLP